jgi:predicted RNase H-like HicB family nuclease
MTFTVEIEQEADGRWLADVIELPGVMAYGTTPPEALQAVQVLALRVIAEKIEFKEFRPASSFEFVQHAA